MTTVEFATGKISLFRQPGARDYIQIGWQNTHIWHLDTSAHHTISIFTMVVNVKLKDLILNDCLHIFLLQCT